MSGVPRGAHPAGGGYRPEIDGLRAVAVVPVVLFHAHMPGVGGGFVGVDVFFVISGFLITGILAGDVAAGRFSLLTFYERRVRRIFPALFALLAVCSALALALLLPHELEDFAASLTSSALFYSNFHYMQSTGYFVGAPDTKPLLHMWSLAVEEQFYIVFPLYLYAMSRLAPRALLPVTLALLALSLALSVQMTRPQSDQAFYYTPARVWELLTGSVLALTRVLPPRRLAEPLALLGLALIAVAVVTFDQRTLFPGVAAILPVAGAALVIWAARGTLAGRLLSAGPVRFIGLISYSLYLWHWPLLVFYRFWRVAPPTPWELALVVAASVAAAILSWRFVERPFRHGAFRRGPVLGAGVAAMAAAALFGTLVTQAQGFPGRFPPGLLALADTRRDEVSFARCNSLPAPGYTPCVIGPGAASDAGFLLWGDSHAGALLPAFEAAAQAKAETGLYMGQGGCVPLVGVSQNREGFDTCDEGAEAILAALAEKPDIGTVILVSRWAQYALGRRFLHEAGHPVFLRDDQTRGASYAENARVFERGLDRTLHALAALGRRVVIVTQVPENQFDLPVAMARAEWLGQDVDFAPLRADYEARQAFVNGLFRAAEAQGRARVLDLGARLCAEPRCPVARSGTPLYRDSNHLTQTHARALASVVAPALGTPGPD